MTYFSDAIGKKLLKLKMKDGSYQAKFDIRFERGQLLDVHGNPLKARPQSEVKEVKPLVINPKGAFRVELNAQKKLKNAWFEVPTTQQTKSGKAVLAKFPLKQFCHGKRYILGIGTYLNLTPKHLRRSMIAGGLPTTSWELFEAVKALLETGEWAFGDTVPGWSEALICSSIVASLLPHSRVRIGMETKEGDAFFVGDVHEYPYFMLIDSLLTDWETRGKSSTQ